MRIARGERIGRGGRTVLDILLSISSEDGAQLREKFVDLPIIPNRDTKPIIAFVVHVANENLAALQFLVDRLHRTIRTAAPQEVRVARRHCETEVAEFDRHPAARGEDS